MAHAGNRYGLSINIHAMGMPFDGETVEKASLGGSESAAHYLAQELSRRGHRVSVWTAKEGTSISGGVRYDFIGESSQETPFGSRFEHYARNTPHDVLIMQRHPAAFHRQFAAKTCIWQLHDLALYRYASSMMAGMWQVDAVTAVSDWHQRQVERVWNINPAVLHVVRNGVDASLYSGESGAPIFSTASGDNFQLPAHAMKLLYQSRPERGLEPLLRAGGIMERLAQQQFQAVLVVAGYDNTVAEMAAFYRQMQERARNLPNVMWVGALAKPELARLQRHCDLMVYPCGAFEEVSCISAMEAMHAGLPLLATRRGALPETCGHAGAVLLQNLGDGTEVDVEAFVDRIVSLRKSRPDLLTLREKQLKASRHFTWSAAADQLEAVIERAFLARLSPGAVLRHAVEYSDVDFGNWYLEQHPATDPLAAAAAQELRSRYAFRESEEAFEAKYAADAREYYAGPGAKAPGEDVTSTTRFRGVMHFVTAKQAEAQRQIRVLDYGCAHGHYAIPIARELAALDSTVTGIDISAEAIEQARAWAAREKLQNANFQSLAEFRQDPPAIGCYDVIVAAEVLEHVRDPDALRCELEQMLAPGGVIVFTTPNGRWEFNEPVKFRAWRQHLRHYERRDIEEFCGTHRHEVLHAPVRGDQAGIPMGSWVWAVWPTLESTWGAIDYDRKLKFLAPRQTISACLIVKDGEKTLQKCVESFIDYVDEVIIAIDPASSDRTERIATQLAADFPNRPFKIFVSESTALRDGFDAVRNESIAAANGDWILWCDADEEVRQAPQLHKLARPSMHNGYGFSQVHYSADPEQVLTTDFPCRLFRNHQGVRFYGMVHEHPEHEIGKAVTWSLVRPEVKFLHAGYVDEDTRRRRYERNLPLVYRDRQKYPGRELNAFLMIRDIAQGLMFEQQQSGGLVLPGHQERAREAIELMERMVDNTAHVRMVADAMQYYTHCVLTSGAGFEADITIKTQHPRAPDLTASFNVRGRFHSKDFYFRVLRKFSEESTKTYEDRYV